MSLWLEKKYLNMAASSLERFVWKSESLANCRCPFCGDSSKNKFKARGYFFSKKGTLIYHCHNCNVGMSLSNFLKEVNPSVHRQYKLEKFKKPVDTTTANTESLSKESFPTFQARIDLPKISELDKRDPAYEYLVRRKIPQEFFDRLYYAEDFMTFCDALIPNHDKKLLKNDRRIVIPYYDQENNLVGVTARSLDPKNDLRYIIMTINPDQPKIFGLETYNKNKKGYVTEGPFDAMFLDNAMASGNSNLLEVLPFGDKNNLTFVFDNEPRNKNIVGAMRGAVDRGCTIFMWPDSLQTKDINELILSGFSRSEAMALIDSRSVSGLQAKFQLTQWSKV